jgi:polyhydroxybutyrate depolymerase
LGGRNGEGNAALGVIGIMPEPMALAPRYSAAKRRQTRPAPPPGSHRSLPLPRRWCAARIQDPNLFDDYTYVRATVEDVLKRLPVDTTRIYAMGQSYGSMATLAFSLRMNDIFAAGAGTGGILLDPFLGLYRSDKVLKGNLMPISVLIGGAEPDNGQNPGVRKNFPYWLERNGLPGDFDKAITGSYKSGRYNITDFANAKGAPLVEYVTVDERIHTIVPMDLYFQYDTFVSKWSRGADGTLHYLGKPVEKQ